MVAPRANSIATTVSVIPQPLAREFRFAHATIRTVDVIKLHIEHDGEYGTGEIAAGIEHGQDTTAIVAESKALADRVASMDAAEDVRQIDSILRECADQVSGPARMLVEMAFLDFAARRARLPVWELLGLPAPGRIQLMHTVPLGAPLADQVRPLKIKLGDSDDLTTLRRLVGLPGPLVLDVNCAWTARDWHRYRSLVQKIAPAVLEDPVRDERLLPEIRAALPKTAVILDEGIVGSADVERAVGLADGANIKLMRFGGLLAARDALEVLGASARTRMLGCYLEPPRAIAYAAQLAGLSDWTDLDGHCWLSGTPPTTEYRLDSTHPGTPRITN
ncbi:enolase C-terminal domain-like protein [Nocardia sp. NPDC003979]